MERHFSNATKFCVLPRIFLYPPTGTAVYLESFRAETRKAEKAEQECRKKRRIEKEEKRRKEEDHRRKKGEGKIRSGRSTLRKRIEKEKEEKIRTEKFQKQHNRGSNLHSSYNLSLYLCATLTL
jgi:hypothetical protein